MSTQQSVAQDKNANLDLLDTTSGRSVKREQDDPGNSNIESVLICLELRRNLFIMRQASISCDGVAGNECERSAFVDQLDLWICKRE